MLSSKELIKDREQYTRVKDILFNILIPPSDISPCENNYSIFEFSIRTIFTNLVTPNSSAENRFHSFGSPAIR